MRGNVWALGLLLVIGSAVGGCELFYRRPAIETDFSKVAVGMDKLEVVRLLGRPTATAENELWYLYDDPTNPVRLRFVLDSKGAVTEKFYETKSYLAEKLKAAERAALPAEPMPGEETRAYPGGPMPQFKQP